MQFAVLAVAVLLLAPPAAAQGEGTLVTPRQLSRVQTVYVYPVISFDEDAAGCRPDAVSLVNEAAGTLTQAGIRVVDKRYTDLEFILTVEENPFTAWQLRPHQFKLGFAGVQVGTTCATAYTLQLWRADEVLVFPGDLAFGSEVGLVVAYESSGVLMGPLHLADSSARDTTRRVALDLAREIRKVRRD